VYRCIVLSCGQSPLVSSMSVTLPMSRVLEIWVNLFLALDSVVVALRGGTAGGIFTAGVAAVFSSAVSGGLATPNFTSDEWECSEWSVVKFPGCETVRVCVVCEGGAERRITRNLMIDERNAFLNTS